jgi:hypothetical protein
MQFPILLLMFIVGQYAEGRELCVFLFTYWTRVCKQYDLDLFLYFLRVLAREHAPNEWDKEVVLHFYQRSS